MTFLSPFQTLPTLIVEIVVDYLEGHSRGAFDADPDVEMEEYNMTKVVQPLLCVSKCWHMAVLRIICDNCEIPLDSTHKGYNWRYPALPVDPSLPWGSMERLVKRVVVIVPSWDAIGSVKFGGTSSREQVDYPVFPSAATLMVSIDDGYPIGIHHGKSSAPNVTPASMMKGTIDLARHIHHLVPAATGVVISFRSPRLADEKYCELCNTLVRELCQRNITRLHVDSWLGRTLTTLNLRTILGLTSVSNGQDMPCAPFAWLAYLNASTLKEINISNVRESDWHTIILGGTKTPAIYSNLTKLIMMVVDYSPHDTTWAAIDNAVPFPTLRKLDVMCGYPFNDDLLFRGNGRTLRGLGLTFKALALNALGQFNVFNRRGVTRMKFVDIDTIGYLDSALLTRPANAHIAQQIHSILGVAEMIVLRGDTTGELVTDAIKTAPNNAVLRVLEVTDQPLDFGDILSIISAVPSLEALACCIKGSVPGIRALPATEHPDALCKRYSSNSNFRQLVIFGVSYSIWGDASNSENADFCNDMYGDEYEDEDYYHGDAEDKVTTCGITKKIAAIAAQISVLCPNLRNVVMARRLHVAFSREIALTMANRLFLPYASTLGRLIFPE